MDMKEYCEKCKTQRKQSEKEHIMSIEEIKKEVRKQMYEKFNTQNKDVNINDKIKGMRSAIEKKLDMEVGTVDLDKGLAYMIKFSSDLLSVMEAMQAEQPQQCSGDKNLPIVPPQPEYVAFEDLEEGKCYDISKTLNSEQDILNKGAFLEARLSKSEVVFRYADNFLDFYYEKESYKYKPHKPEEV